MERGGKKEKERKKERKEEKGRLFAIHAVCTRRRDIHRCRTLYRSTFHTVCIPGWNGGEFLYLRAFQVDTIREITNFVQITRRANIKSMVKRRTTIFLSRVLSSCRSMLISIELYQHSSRDFGCTNINNKYLSK